MNVRWPSRRANLDYSGDKHTVFVATTYSALPNRVTMYTILAGNRDIEIYYFGPDQCQVPPTLSSCRAHRSFWFQKIPHPIRHFVTSNT